MKKLAILIPLHKSNLNDHEKKSLQYIVTNLDNKNIFLILPEKLRDSFNYKNLNKVYFSDKYFISQKTYNKLLLSLDFFLKFNSFDYALIYQLDSYLIQGTERLKDFFNEDYVGSPHINVKKKRFNGILNGGFSLRAIGPSINVLSSVKIHFTLNSVISILRYFTALNRLKSFIKFFFKIIFIYISDKFYKKEKILISQIIINNFADYYNEDIFWSLFSKLFVKNFKVAKFDTAIKFSFDKDPEVLFGLNDNQLPLGCHNWWNDKNINFWKKYF